MSEKTPQTWEAVVDRLPFLLTKLTDSDVIARNANGTLPAIPGQGIYVFYESGIPLYVGRSDRMRSRILEHSRPSSLHNSATFAFLLAMEAATGEGIDCSGRTRADLQSSADFKPL